MLSPALSEPGRCPPGPHNLLPAPPPPPWAARPRALQAVWGWEHLVVEGGLQLVPVCLLASVSSSTKWDRRSAFLKALSADDKQSGSPAGLPEEKRAKGLISGRLV